MASFRFNPTKNHCPMNLGTRVLVGDSDHDGSGALTTRFLRMSPCLSLLITTTAHAGSR